MSNPELPQTTSETNTPSGWDEVSRLSNQQPPVRLDNRPDKGLNEGRREVLRQRLEKRLGNAFGLVIEGLLYEGDRNNPSERRNEHCYTEFMALKPIISMEEQGAMIKEYCGTGKVEKTLGDANKKLAKAILESEFANEIWHDGSFCRRRRTDYLAGRLIFTDENRLDEAILKSIWAIDPNFYGSKEARGLIADPDYIHYIYGKKIKDILDQYQLDSPVVDATAKSYEKQLSEAIETCLEDGTLTTEEILSDPFLRQLHMAAHLRHFDSRSSTGPLRATERIWELDGADFYNSPIFVNYLNEIRADNIGVLKDVPVDEVYERIATIIGEISDKKLLEILQAYSRDQCHGDNVLKDSLLPYLGLLNKPPNILYFPSDDKEGGADYYHETNQIHYYVDSDSWQNPAPPQPVLFDDDLFERMNTIAHEMFHAHQTHGDNVDPKLRELYEQNKLVYIRSEFNYDTYREQITECGAYFFGDNLELRLREVFGAMKQEEENEEEK